MPTVMTNTTKQRFPQEINLILLSYILQDKQTVQLLSDTLPELLQPLIKYKAVKLNVVQPDKFHKKRISCLRTQEAVQTYIKDELCISATHRKANSVDAYLDTYYIVLDANKPALKEDELYAPGETFWINDDKNLSRARKLFNGGINGYESVFLDLHIPSQSRSTQYSTELDTIIRLIDNLKLNSDSSKIASVHLSLIRYLTHKVDTTQLSAPPCYGHKNDFPYISECHNTYTFGLRTEYDQHHKEMVLDFLERDDAEGASINAEKQRNLRKCDVLGIKTSKERNVFELVRSFDIVLINNTSSDTAKQEVVSQDEFEKQCVQSQFELQSQHYKTLTSQLEYLYQKHINLDSNLLAFIQAYNASKSRKSAIDRTSSTVTDKVQFWNELQNLKSPETFHSFIQFIFKETLNDPDFRKTAASMDNKIKSLPQLRRPSRTLNIERALLVVPANYFGASNKYTAQMGVSENEEGKPESAFMQEFSTLFGLQRVKKQFKEQLQTYVEELAELRKSSHSSTKPYIEAFRFRLIHCWNLRLSSKVLKTQPVISPHQTSWKKYDPKSDKDGIMLMNDVFEDFVKRKFENISCK